MSFILTSDISCEDVCQWELGLTLAVRIIGIVQHIGFEGLDRIYPPQGRGGRAGSSRILYCTTPLQTGIEKHYYNPYAHQKPLLLQQDRHNSTTI